MVIFLGKSSLMEIVKQHKKATAVRGMPQEKMRSSGAEEQGCVPLGFVARKLKEGIERKLTHGSSRYDL